MGAAHHQALCCPSLFLVKANLNTIPVLLSRCVPPPPQPPRPPCDDPTGHANLVIIFLFPPPSELPHRLFPHHCAITPHFGRSLPAIPFSLLEFLILLLPSLAQLPEAPCLLSLQGHLGSLTFRFATSEYLFVDRTPGTYCNMA